MKPLSERIRVAHSARHGRGLFARQRFREGAKIGDFVGRPTERNGEHVLWLFDDEGNSEAIEVTNELRFLNHSSKPNAEIEGLELYAIRNIQPGSEVTIDYGTDWVDVE